jgi:hypothetical protein
MLPFHRDAHINDPEAERLAVEVAELAGESKARAVGPAHRRSSTVMSKRARRRNSSPRPSLPASRRASDHHPTTTGRSRPCADVIADGEFDHSLHALVDAIQARLHLLHTVKAATALAHLTVGDEVRINHNVKPRYLHGAHGRIIDLDHQTATVCLHRPIGRFTSGQIRCPPLALDRLPRAA